jgi:hypothetical protein
MRIAVSIDSLSTLYPYAPVYVLYLHFIPTGLHSNVMQLKSMSRMETEGMKA